MQLEGGPTAEVAEVADYQLPLSTAEFGGGILYCHVR